MPSPYVAAPTRRNGPHRALGTFRWGLVPSWAKDPSVGSRMINARAEGIATKPAFRTALARRRCVIPADAFYEWQRRAEPTGAPPASCHMPSADGTASRWPSPGSGRSGDRRPGLPAGPVCPASPTCRVGRACPASPAADPFRTCAIVTTAANDMMAPIHDRMPVVLSPEDWDTWLSPDSDRALVAGLLVPAPSVWFERYPVGSLVNDVRNDGPDSSTRCRPHRRLRF